MTLSNVDGVIHLYLLLPDGGPAPLGSGRGRPDTPAGSHRELRRLLRHATGLPVDTLEIAEDVHGKPILTDPDLRGRLSFSKADAAGAVLLATTGGSPLGVDLEAQRSIAERDLIVDNYFHPDEAASIRSEAGAQQDRAFLRTWVRKEAFLKAIGLGLSIDLNAFTVAAPDGRVRMAETLTNVEGSWWCSDLDLPEPWIGALCTDQPGVSLEYHAVAPSSVAPMSDVARRNAT